MKVFQWGINAFLLWSAVFTAQAQSPKRSVPALPRPEGPFAVGRAGFDWRDQTRPEVLSKVPAKRELMVYLWYPADAKDATAKAAPYLPGAAAINKLSDRALVEGDGKLWPFILSGQIKSHAVEDVAVARDPSRFPLLIFSHGLGSPVFYYTSLIEGLVSHGYVVASIEHTYEVNAVAFPDRKVGSRPVADLVGYLRPTTSRHFRRGGFEEGHCLGEKEGRCVGGRYKFCSKSSREA